MTKLLKKAIAEARRLPPAEQDAIGAIILEDIAARAIMTLDFDLRAVVKRAGAEAAHDPFATFNEWNSRNDRHAYKNL